MYYIKLSTNGIIEEFYCGSLKKLREEIHKILSTYTLNYHSKMLYTHRTLQQKMLGKGYNDFLRLEIENTKIRISKIRKV